MTPRYWLKIVLAMLLIFGIGMTVRAAVRAGHDKVVTFAEGTDPITVPLLGMPFRTTGRGELGVLRSLRIERDAPKEIEGFYLTARLNDGVDPGQFDSCEVTVNNPEEINAQTAFACLTEADSAYADLVEFGTITFEPSGAVHRLMVPSAIRNQIRSAFDSGAAALGDSVRVDSTDGGNITVRINGKPIVEIKADQAGAHVQVSDPSGKKVVEVRAN